jgi:hypothetical protein
MNPPSVICKGPIAVKLFNSVLGNEFLEQRVTLVKAIDMVRRVLQYSEMCYFYCLVGIAVNLLAGNANIWGLGIKGYLFS